MLPPRIKEILFNKIKSDLSNCEMIVTKSEEIWFIDVETNKWYLSFSNNNTLYYYFEYFSSILPIFSVDKKDYNLILREFAYDILETYNPNKKWRKIGNITPLSSKLESLIELVKNEKN